MSPAIDNPIQSRARKQAITKRWIQQFWGTLPYGRGSDRLYTNPETALEMSWAGKTLFCETKPITILESTGGVIETAKQTHRITVLAVPNADRLTRAYGITLSAA